MSATAVSSVSLDLSPPVAFTMLSRRALKIPSCEASLVSVVRSLAAVIGFITSCACVWAVRGVC